MNHLKLFLSFILLLCAIYSCKSQPSNKIIIPPKECIELNNKGVKCLMAFPDNDGKELDSAITFFNEAIKGDTTYLIAYLNLTNAYDRKKQYNNEKIGIDKILMLSNNAPSFLTEKGILFEKMNNIDSANRSYQLAKIGYDKKFAEHPSAGLIDGMIMLTALTKGKQAAITELNEQLKNHPEWSSKLAYLYEFYKDFDKHAYVYRLATEQIVYKHQ